MAFEQKSLEDYIDVAQRIADFRAAYPEGSLRPWNPAEPWRLIQAEGWEKSGDHVMQTFIVVVAAAYRHGLDDNPGIGMAWEIFPGRTPYTRGSELMNAETSAWGRALIAVGASDSKRGIASREEVRNRQAERDGMLPAAEIIEQVRAMRRADPEVDEHGAATLAEQTRMMTGPEVVERLGTTPVDDPWLDGPAGLSPTDDPEDRPGTSSAAQIREMHALFGQLGVKERDARLTLTRSVLGMDMLASSKQLSYRQAGDLLLALRDQAKARAGR